MSQPNQNDQGNGNGGKNQNDQGTVPVIEDNQDGVPFVRAVLPVQPLSAAPTVPPLLVDPLDPLPVPPQ